MLLRMIPIHITRPPFPKLPFSKRLANADDVVSGIKPGMIPCHPPSPPHHIPVNHSKGLAALICHTSVPDSPSPRKTKFPKIQPHIASLLPSKSNSAIQSSLSPFNPHHHHAQVTPVHPNSPSTFLHSPLPNALSCPIMTANNRHPIALTAHTTPPPSLRSASTARSMR